MWVLWTAQGINIVNPKPARESQGRMVITYDEINNSFFRSLT